MPAKTDLKFLLTTDEPASQQTDPSQSVGGYCSSTPMSLSALLSSTVSNSTTTISLNDSIGTPDLLLIDNEIINAEGSEDTFDVLNRGYLSTVSVPHIYTTVVKGIRRNSLFNNSFSNTYKQYRCVAVKNTSTSGAFSNLKLYVKYPSINSDTSIRIAVEVPITGVIVSAASSGTTLSLADSSLARIYSDNYFAGCVLTIKSGTNTNSSRLITSYTSSTGTFVFDTLLDDVITAGTEYVVDSRPIQRLPDGITAPTANSYLSDFVTANGPENAIPINISGKRVFGNSLGPNDVVYLWIEKTGTNKANEFTNNRVILTARYEV